MDGNLLYDKLKSIYTDYQITIKPLIADIEARYQSFPDSLFNEIRAMNDHISRCYIDDSTDEYIIDQIEKAKGHLFRIIFDCYKYLDVWFDKYVKDFDKKYVSKVDITLIDNGEFAIKYRKLQRDVLISIREAKRLEGLDKQKSFDFYQKSYNIFSELEHLIVKSTDKLNWAKIHKITKKSITVLVWVISIIISSIITIFIGCDDVILFIRSVLGI
jgi:hypothetical protein